MSQLQRTDLDLANFLALSVEITAFSPVHVLGTGLVANHLATLDAQAGKPLADALLAAWVPIAAIADDQARHIALRSDIFDSPRLGPLAGALVKLWYVGTWYPPSAQWRAANAPGGAADPFVPQPAAYVEGLLWPAIGAHPPGAKAPGYGSWAKPPVIPKF